LLYAAASLLSFATAPDKVWLLFFIGVFGPAAIVLAASETRLGQKMSAAIAVAAFILLFYLFGVALAFGGGFIPRIGLPETGIPALYIALGFAVFSAVIACIVNRGLYAMLMRRVAGSSGRSADNAAARSTDNVSTRNADNAAARSADNASTRSADSAAGFSAINPSGTDSGKVMTIVLPKLSDIERTDELKS